MKIKSLLILLSIPAVLSAMEGGGMRTYEEEQLKKKLEHVYQQKETVEETQDELNIGNFESIQSMEQQIEEKQALLNEKQSQLHQQILTLTQFKTNASPEPELIKIRAKIDRITKEILTLTNEIEYLQDKINDRTAQILEDKLEETFED